MFIVSTKSGKNYKEGEAIGAAPGKTKGLTWDDIPRDVRISGIQLTYPFRVELKEEKRSFAPTLTIGKFDRYFFYNEARVNMVVVGNKPVQTGQSVLIAKVVGGIEDKTKMVFEVRLDRLGNCTNSRYPLKELEARIKAGTFRMDIIREGS